MVASFTQLLERRYKGQFDEDADDYIGFIVEGTNRMKDLIDDLLAFSRLNSETRELEIVDTNSVLEDVLFNLKTSIEGNNAEINQESFPEIVGDYSQLVQLFQNLIANAIKFNDKPVPQIHISGQEDGNQWIFQVRDNGIGIDLNHQERIFKVFNRLHTRDLYEGTGIGLALCKKIVERHGGKIWVESEEGQGSTFYFTIPKDLQA